MNKPKRVPIRTCVVCRETDAKKALIRVVRQKTADGGVIVLVDQSGKMNGRGAYVCQRSECVEIAIKQRKLERSLHVTAVPVEFTEQLRSAITAVSPGS